jgi:hypothetical protein
MYSTHSCLLLARTGGMGHGHGHEWHGVASLVASVFFELSVP